MHPIIFFKVLSRLSWYFEDKELFNGVSDNRYTFKQLTPKKMHFKITKKEGKMGKYTSIKNKSVIIGDLDKEMLLDILDQFISYDKKVLIYLIPILSKKEVKLLDRLTENYSKFYSEIPETVI